MPLYVNLLRNSGCHSLLNKMAFISAEHQINTKVLFGLKKTQLVNFCLYIMHVQFYTINTYCNYLRFCIGVMSSIAMIFTIHICQIGTSLLLIQKHFHKLFYTDVQKWYKIQSYTYVPSKGPQSFAINTISTYYLTFPHRSLHCFPHLLCLWSQQWWGWMSVWHVMGNMSWMVPNVDSAWTQT